MELVTTVAVEYTLSEMILLAAQKLEEQGQSPFSAEDLIVASWLQFPKAFGLKGYAEQYPDANRVLASIMGAKGLASKGWLSKVGQKLYTLSKEGQRVVRRIVEGGDGPLEDEAARLPRDQEKLLLGLLESAVAEKVAGKRGHELSFADACRFWEIPQDHVAPEALDARLEAVEATLNAASTAAIKGTLFAGQREITPVDVELAREANEHLQERFARHLSLLRARSR